MLTIAINSPNDQEKKHEPSFTVDELKKKKWEITRITNNQTASSVKKIKIGGMTS